MSASNNIPPAIPWLQDELEWLYDYIYRLEQRRNNINQRLDEIMLRNATMSEDIQDEVWYYEQFVVNQERLIEHIFEYIKGLQYEHDRLLSHE